MTGTLQGMDAWNARVNALLEDEDRAEIVRKSCEETNAFIASLKPTEHRNEWPEDRWEEESQKHPLFITEIKDGDELPPLVEAMQQLKYDPEMNSPVEMAQQHKEDGNEEFKKKMYKYAVAAYTEGLNVKCEDDQLNAILYTNRATAHYHMGHYEQSLEGATSAKKLNPRHVKAFYRGAQCYLKLERYDDCILWCDEGLKLKYKDKALLDLKENARTQKVVKERFQAEDAQKLIDLETLNKAIKKRGINIKGKGLTLDSLVCDHAKSTAKVHLTDEGVLNWPVVLLYPQYHICDLIEAFNEDLSFYEYISEVLENPAEWDINKEYTAENVKVYFTDCAGNIVPVDDLESLKTAMCNKRFQVTSGTLNFNVVSCEYDETYRAQNPVKF